MKAKNRQRTRCTSCRRWFVPEATAVQHQKTCGTECRRQRRNQGARRRRLDDIHEHRIDERGRQALSRERGRDLGETADVSRAGLRPQAMQIELVVMKKWDKLARVSRAGLRREIRMALGSAGEIVGQESAVA